MEGQSVPTTFDPSLPGCPSGLPTSTHLPATHGSHPPASPPPSRRPAGALPPRPLRRLGAEPRCWSPRRASTAPACPTACAPTCGCTRQTASSDGSWTCSCRREGSSVCSGRAGRLKSKLPLQRLPAQAPTLSPSCRRPGAGALQLAGAAAGPAGAAGRCGSAAQRLQVGGCSGWPTGA